MNPEIPADRWEIFAQGLDHPECVAFDRDGNLWAGGEAGQIYRINPAGAVEKVADLGGFVGGIAFRPDDDTLYACCPIHGVVRVSRDGTWDVVATEADDRKIVTPNYGVFDSRGRYYVTDSGLWKRRDGRAGRLIRIDHTAHSTVIAGPFGYANGLALSADERTLYMVESDTNRVLRFILSDAGEVRSQEVYAEDVGRMPDGLALDVDGNLYVSCYASDDIWKVTPGGRKSLFAWDPWAILLSRPTNMAFDGDTMYVANLGRTTVTRARVGVTGMPLANRRNREASCG